MDSLWVRWVTKRYLDKQNIWSAKPTSAGSWIWPKLLASRNWIKPEIRYIIFSGRNLKAWTDPWIKGKSLAELSSPQDQQGVIGT
ncbi:hypothetical protein QJS04_geneDACA008287 [Acorus gramineus]|uniref:Uncharacterized protein n=1 Tax=Acorus gramineus TaxID=55184 RepID=A0AAV9AZ36_ACOGR|nr:hypothetical protein QJS04_geneDACA008287 [Acorus gramineus]